MELVQKKFIFDRGRVRNVPGNEIETLNVKFAINFLESVAILLILVLDQDYYILHSHHRFLMRKLFFTKIAKRKKKNSLILLIRK